MQIRLKIEYAVDAEPGESKVEEDRALGAMRGMVETFASNLVDSAKAEGLTVSVER